MCACISVSVHKRRVILRWPENVAIISRNRGNVTDLLTGTISATTPPPAPLNLMLYPRPRKCSAFCYYPSPTESDPVTEITENVCYYPPPPH